MSPKKQNKIDLKILYEIKTWVRGCSGKILKTVNWNQNPNVSEHLTKSQLLLVPCKRVTVLLYPQRLLYVHSVYTCMGVPGSTVCVGQKLLCVCRNVTSVSTPLSPFALRPCLLVHVYSSSVVGVQVLILKPFFFLRGPLCFQAVLSIETLDGFHLLWVVFLERLVLCTLHDTSNTLNGL